MPLPLQLRPGEAPLTDKAAPTRVKGLGLRVYRGLAIQTRVRVGFCLGAGHFDSFQGLGFKAVGRVFAG